jgi:hypothetical protein
MAQTTESRALRLAKRLARVLPPVRSLSDQRDRFAAEVSELRAAAAASAASVADGDGDGQVQGVGSYPPGHFYSPIPDLADVWAHADAVWAQRRDLPGVDLQEEAQLALVDTFAALVGELPFEADPVPGLRYHMVNPYFSNSDGIALYGFLRTYRPRRVVEVGSGFSSACMLDVDERFLDSATQFTFIEPYPDRLKSLLRPKDLRDGRVRLIEQGAQWLDRSTFSDLQAGDFLFIDSSHVIKVGSEVNLLLLDVLPSLPPGVHVHVHDIPWPFEYSGDWLREGRYWNEAYLMRALLVGNANLRITWFSNYLKAVHGDVVSRKLPYFGPEDHGGTSLWLITQ